MLAAKNLLVKHYQKKQAQTRHDQIAVETPIAIICNGISHAVMMASPGDLEDFALGFCLSEGIIQRASELLDCQINETAQGIELQLTLIERRMHALRERRRTLLGRTGCGLCGTESLAQALQPVTKVQTSFKTTIEDLHAGFQTLATAQTLNHATGAMHAAALWRMTPTPELLIREDLGRHNALDKIIGAAAKASQDWAQAALLLTSRASYELLHKAALANLPLVAAISAPTSQAIAVAEAANITLLGFFRDDHFTCYHQGAGVFT